MAMITTEDFKALSKNELVSVAEFNYKALSITTAEGLETAIQNLKHLIPYDYAVSAINNVRALKIKIIDVMNISYPPEFLENYFKHSFEHKDPLLDSHIKHFTVQVWSDILNKTDSDPILEHLAGDFNMNEGFVFGMLEPTNHINSFFCFAGTKLTPETRHITVCNMVAPLLHQAYMWVLPTKVRTLMGHPVVPNLTEREKEMLKWLKQGKTNWEISVILRISESTVKHHFRNIVSKLDATGKAHAMAKALQMRIIPF